MVLLGVYDGGLVNGPGRRPRQPPSRRGCAPTSAESSLLANGTLRPQVAARFPLEQVAAVMQLAESRTAIGKVVLVPTVPGA